MRSVEGVGAGLTEDLPAVSFSVVDDVDHLRAGHYDLLAALLGRAPTSAILDQLSGVFGDDSQLGRAYGELAAAARVPAKGVARAYFVLFIGVGRGELVPYASYYLTGFLNERPLGRLRADLDALGIERSEDMSEPEDHIAIVLETMAGLASGRFETPPGADRRFFERHVQPWASRFFGDLARAGLGGSDAEEKDGTRFYRAVGELGQALIEIETQAYALDA